MSRRRSSWASCSRSRGQGGSLIRTSLSPSCSTRTSPSLGGMCPTEETNLGYIRRTIKPVPDLARLQGLKPGTRAGSRCLRPPGLWRCRVVAMASRRIPVTRESGPGDHPGGLVHNHGTRRSAARQPYLVRSSRRRALPAKALSYLRPKGAMAQIGSSVSDAQA